MSQTYSSIWDRLKRGESVPVGDLFRPIAIGTKNLLDPLAKGLADAVRGPSQSAAQSAGNLGRELNANLVQPVLEHPSFQGFVNQTTDIGTNVGNRVIETYNQSTGNNLNQIPYTLYEGGARSRPLTVDSLSGPDTGVSGGGEVVTEGGDTVESTERVSSNDSNYFQSTPAPAFTSSTDFRDYMAEAVSSLQQMYGDAQNFEEIEANYLNEIQRAYESIVGEGGTFEQARQLADQRFGLARSQAERGFRESRQQLAEQSFLGERQMQQALAQRGLGGSGLAQLGRVQQKIAQGGAVSNLYRDFVNSVQQLSLQEAQTDLGFAEAEANLNLALTKDLQNIQNRFRQERQAYNQWRGNTLASLSESIKNGNMQSYQIKIDEWNRGLSMAQMMDQEAKDSASFELDIIKETYGYLISNVANRQDLNDQQKANEVSRLQNEMSAKMDQVGASVGFSSGDLASGIIAANQGPAVQTRDDRIFTDQEGSFRGVLPSLGRLAEELGPEGAVTDFILGDPETYFNNWFGLTNNRNSER